MATLIQPLSLVAVVVALLLVHSPVAVQSAPTVSEPTLEGDRASLLAFVNSWTNVANCGSWQWNNYTEICYWPGVTCNTTADNETRVVRFEWQNAGCEGTPVFQYLPSALQHLGLNGNAFNGTVDFSVFPASLQHIGLSLDSSSRWLYGFGGTLDTSQLPASLRVLELAFNSFTGMPDFASLPASLQVLDLTSNNIAGVPNLSALPQGLQFLYLDGNENICGSTTCNLGCMLSDNGLQLPGHCSCSGSGTVVCGNC